MNVNKWLRCVAVVAVASTAACGGGGGGSSGGGGSTPVVDAPVGGLWAGTVTPQGQPASEVFGIVTEDGRAYFLDEFSQMYWGFVDASGTTLHGDMTMADADGFLLWDDSHSAEVTLTGSVQARTRLTANWNLVTSNASRQQGVMSVQYDGLYAEDSSLAKVAGNYRDVLGGDDVVNVAANGTLFSQSASSSCVVNGTVALIDPAWNAYDVEFAYSNCAPNEWYHDAEFSGVAFFVPGDNSLVVMAHRTNGVEPEPFFLYLDPA